MRVSFFILLMVLFFDSFFNFEEFIELILFMKMIDGVCFLKK